MLKTKVAPHEAYLRNKGLLARYLAVAARDPNPDAFVMAIAALARAKGMGQVARESGLGRESLYKALARGAKPRYETVRRLVEALGLHLTVGARGSVVRSVRLRAPRIDARGGRRSTARSAVRFRGRPSLPR